MSPQQGSIFIRLSNGEIFEDGFYLEPYRVEADGLKPDRFENRAITA